MSKSQRDKGNRIEREIVDQHKAIGVHAERVPLSGASYYRDGHHDVDIYAFGTDAAPLVAEVKARGQGQGFTVLERWLADNDILFLRRDRREPLVLNPWSTWKRLLDELRQLRDDNIKLRMALKAYSAVHSDLSDQASETRKSA